MSIRLAPTLWNPKDPAHRLPAAFRFGGALNTGETIASFSQPVISTRSGVDASPASVLDGAATLQGSDVVQWVIGGVDGVSYLIRCATTTSAGRVLVAAGVLSIRTIR